MLPVVIQEGRASTFPLLEKILFLPHHTTWVAPLSQSQMLFFVMLEPSLSDEHRCGTRVLADSMRPDMSHHVTLLHMLRGISFVCWPSTCHSTSHISHAPWLFTEGLALDIPHHATLCPCSLAVHIMAWPLTCHTMSHCRGLACCLAGEGLRTGPYSSHCNGPNIGGN